MRPRAKCKVLIAGAGPAGLASALYLLRQRPYLGGQIVALEKARHPRFKACGGGLVPKVLSALADLGLRLRVPAVAVRAGIARTEFGEVDLSRADILCTIVRRDEFDAWLAREARAAGLEIVENCRVLGVENGCQAVRAVTERGVFETSVLIGADGSGSLVQRAVFGRHKEPIGRALMADVPAPEAAVEFTRRLYRFDFRCVSAGIRGYSWSFPCLIGARPHLNVGIYDQSPREPVRPGCRKGGMLEQLCSAFPDLGLQGLLSGKMSFKAFPIRWYEPAARFACGRVILAGDAAGVDPLMGEGISCAFEHGRLAAHWIGQFLDGDGEALARYNGALHHGAVGRKLRKLAFAARRFYGPHHRLYFWMAGLSRRAQEIGVDWYNGARGFDELAASALIRKWAAAVLFGVPVR